MAAAKEALGYAGQFASPPAAKLVILPHAVIGSNFPPGASLTYQVELLIEDGTDATARHQYIIDARDSHVVWHFDNLTRQVRPLPESLLRHRRQPVQRPAIHHHDFR